jgi:ribosomal protein S12 methylthiotransferase
VGCFRYEPVAGATANDLGAPVAVEVKEERWNRLMAHQRDISQKRLKRKVGNRERVIIDEVAAGSKSANSTSATGRGKGDAPQIDGVVHISSHRPLRVGEIATVKIDRADAYDLHGTVVGY